jgi:hypothetical protein
MLVIARVVRVKIGGKFTDVASEDGLCGAKARARQNEAALQSVDLLQEICEDADDARKALLFFAARKPVPGGGLLRDSGCRIRSRERGHHQISTPLEKSSRVPERGAGDALRIDGNRQNNLMKGIPLMNFDSSNNGWRKWSVCPSRLFRERLCAIQ